MSIRIRRGTAASAAANNPILADGEIAIETDTGVLKVGDGATAWTGLPPVLKSTFARRFMSPTARPMSVTRITSPATIAVMGVDPGNPGRVFGSNRSFGPYSLSNDNGATWTNGSTVAPGTTNTSVQKFVVLGSYVYVMATDSTSGQVGIYRSTNTSAPSGWSWSAALYTFPAGIEGKSTIFNAGSQYLFAGEYEAAGTNIAALGGPQLVRSADGVTWETVWGRDSTVKHIHCVAEDPYNPGHVYMTLGDNGTPHSVMRSTNHGAAGTWTPIITGGDNNWQSVQISFSPDWVWLASDRDGFKVAVFDRTDLTPYSVAVNDPYMMGVPGAAVTTDRFYQIGYLGAVDPVTGVFYLSQNDTSTSGNTFGHFYLPQMGGRLELVDFWKNGTAGYLTHEVFVANGKVYMGNAIIQAFQPVP